jgi:hypothetical protein
MGGLVSLILFLGSLLLIVEVLSWIFDVTGWSMALSIWFSENAKVITIFAALLVRMLLRKGPDTRKYKINPPSAELLRTQDRIMVRYTQNDKAGREPQ